MVPNREVVVRERGCRWGGILDCGLFYKGTKARYENIMAGQYFGLNKSFAMAQLV